MVRSLSLPVAVVVTLVAANIAHAQSPRGPYLPPDAKGYRIQQIMQAWRQATRAEAATTRPAGTVSHPTPAPEARPAEVQIAISVPDAGNNPSATVAIRGPDGDVRTFPVEGGREALQSRVIVVRPGGSVTIRFVPRR